VPLARKTTAPRPTRAPSPVPSPTPVLQSSIGTAHPSAVIAAGSDGSWVALCQARADSNADGRIAARVGAQGELSGDRLDSYLVLGSGPGSAIDELLAYEPSGRFLAVKRRGQLQLIDAHAKVELPLGAGPVDLRSDAVPYRGHRTVRFDSESRRMLYVRSHVTQGEVVIRDLRTGLERSIDPGPGEVWRAEFDNSGDWVLISVLNEDTNNTGKLEWPAPAAGPNSSQCTGSIPRLSVWSPRGDMPHLRIARSDEGGPSEPVAGFVTTLADGVVTRDLSGRLLWTQSANAASSGAPDAAPKPKPSTYEIASAKCDGRVLYADNLRKLVLLACAGAVGHWPLWLVGPDQRATLGVELAPSDTFRPAERSPRLLPIYPPQTSALVDLSTRTLKPLQNGDLVLGTHQAFALIQRGTELVLLDADTGQTTSLARGVADLPDVLLNASTVFVSPFAVDVAKGRLFGRMEPATRPLALSRDGRVLLGARKATVDFPLGPLRWASPQP
jgi:hypothetical protein